MMRASAMQRSINLRAIIILLAATIVLGAAVHVVHGIQVKRNAGALLVRADQAEADGKPIAAIECLVAYLSLQPNDNFVRGRFALLLSKHARSNRQRQEACMVLEEVLRADASRTDLRRELVRASLDLERFVEAKPHLEILLPASPHDAELSFLMGRCEEGLQNYESALAWYAKTCELQPDRTDAYLRQARLLRDALGNPERADSVIKSFVEHNVDAPTARLAAAKYFAQLSRWDDADSHLEFILKQQPAPEPSVYAWAAEIAMSRGDRDTALFRLRSGIEQHPADPGLRLTLARSQVELGRRVEALETLQPLLASHPRQTDDLVRLASLLIDLNEPEKAGAVVDRLRGKAPPAIVGFLRAHFLVQQQEWGQARVLLGEVIPSLASPDWLLQANLLLAQCQHHLGNWEGELAAYTSAVGAHPGNIAAGVGRAAALLRLGRLDEAIGGYRSVVARSPEIAVPLARLLLTRNLRLPASARDWQEVEKVLEGVPETLRNSSDMSILRAELLSAKDRPDEARSLLEAEREKHPDQLSLWLASVELAEYQGRHADAAGLADDAARRFPSLADPLLIKARFATRDAGERGTRDLEQLETEFARLDPPEQNRMLGALGDAYSRMGETAKATKFWKRLAAQEPKNLTVRMPLFAAAAQAGDEGEMERLLAEIRHIEGTGGSFGAYAEAALLVTRAHRGQKQLLAKARERATTAASQRPSWSANILLQAQIADLDGDTDAALPLYQRAVELGEHHPTVIRRTVDLLYRRQRYVEAQQIIKKLSSAAALESGLGRRAAVLTLLTTADSDATRSQAFEMARQAIPSDSTDYRDFLWLGQVALGSGQPVEAEKMFRRAAALDPTSIDPWIALLSMVVQSDRARAHAVIEEVRGKLPAEQAALALAPTYEMLGQLEDAQKQYDAILALKPDDADALGSIAGFFVRTNQPDKAEKSLRGMLNLPQATGERNHNWARRHLAVLLGRSGHRGYIEAMELLARNQPPTLDDQLARGILQATQLNQRDSAIATLEHVHQQRPLQPQELFILARLHDAAGQRERALGHLVSVVETDSPDPQHLAYLIEVLLKHGFNQAAGDWLAKLEKLKPDPFLTVSLRAKWLQKKGQPSEAVQLVTSFAQSNPNALAKAAALLEEIGRAGDAESLYRMLAERQKPAGVLLLAQYLGRRQRVPEALDLCEPLWRAVPAEAIAETCLAVLRPASTNEENYQRVDNWLVAAIQHHPQSTRLAALRAELQFHARRYSESIASYRELLRRDPDNVIALNLLAWMLALKDGQGTEALAMIERAIALMGPQPDLLDTRAMVYLTLRQPAQAIKDLNEVVKFSPSASAYFHLALAHHQGKDRARTEEAFRKARDAGIGPAVLHPLEQRAFDDLVGALGE